MRIASALLIANWIAVAAMAEDAPTHAYDLVTTEEASGAFGETVESGLRSPFTNGMSNCSWLAEGSQSVVALTLQKGAKAFAGMTPDENYERSKIGFGSQGTLEELPGLGEKAFIVTIPISADSAMYTLVVLKNAALLTIAASKIKPPPVLTIATAAAGRL